MPFRSHMLRDNSLLNALLAGVPLEKMSRLFMFFGESDDRPGWDDSDYDYGPGWGA